MRRLCRSAVALALLAAAAGAAAQGADPAINAPYRDPSYNLWRFRFEHAGREIYDRRREIVAALGLRPGMAVADVGTGSGLFARLFAAEVGPAGTVYAVDVAESFVAGAVERAREEGLRLVGVLGTQRSTNLPRGSIELVFVCDAYHHFEDPRAMLASIRAALKPGGRLALIDFERIPGVSPEWVFGHVRAGKETFRREIEQAGFRLEGEVKLLGESYFLRFARDPD